MPALSSIQDPSLRDWVDREIITEAKLEADYASINLAVKSILDYCQENERGLSASAAPTDTADGMIWYDSNNTVFKGRISAAWETLVSETQTQTLTNKTLTSPTISSPTFGTGGTATHGSAGNIDVNTTAVARTTVGNLITYTLPANTVGVKGQGLRSAAWVTKAGGAGLDVVGIGLPANTAALESAVTDNIQIAYEVRTGAASGKNVSISLTNRDDSGTPADLLRCDATTVSNDYTGANTILGFLKTASGDTISNEAQIVEYIG